LRTFSKPFLIFPHFLLNLSLFLGTFS
jgi:hypothetical protein